MRLCAELLAYSMLVGPMDTSVGCALCGKELYPDTARVMLLPNQNKKPVFFVCVACAQKNDLNVLIGGNVRE